MLRTSLGKAQSLPERPAHPCRSRPERDGLVDEIARLALLPALIVGLLMTAALAGLQTRQTEHAQIVDAQAAAEWIALAAAPALLEGGPTVLDRLTAGGRARQESFRVRILSTHGDVLAAAGNEEPSIAWRQRGTAAITDAGGGRIGTVLFEAGHPPVSTLSRHDLLLASALLLSLALAAVFARRGARRIGAPIAELADAVASSDPDRLARPVTATAPGEVRRLQEGINAASFALQEARRDMQRQIERATLELERKNAALEAAKLARSRFLAAASHDLRQPLSALTLFSSALTLGEKDPVRLSRITHIRECVDSLDHLFNSLLDLSRLETGAMQPSPCDFPLDTLFEEVSRTFRMSAEQRGLRLIVRKTDAFVRCDRVMLSRILNNLACNAVRYTANGGVLLGARRRGGKIRIDVWDTGPGIAPELQERVFEEFFQAHGNTAPAGRRQGLGLGLATVRRLCDLLDLPIRLRSRPERGTLFTIEVPLAARGPSHAEGRLQDRPLDVSGLRVLVIDDEPSILEGLQVLMESWGCKVGTAADGDAAMRIAGRWPQPPDIVVSDLQLGGGRSGLDVLRQLQRHYGARGHGFARLLITGETKPERLREISASRIPVLYKPVTPEQLREAMVATIAVRNIAA